MSFSSTIASPVVKGEVKKSFRKPASMPEAEGATSPYVISLKKDCPTERIDLLGVTFQKSVYSPDHSKSENYNASPEEKFIVMALSNNQKEAILSRAREVDLHIPARHNWKTGKIEERVTINAGDWIIIEPKETFNPMKHTRQDYMPEEVPEDMSNAINEEVYKHQAKKKTKGK